MASAKTFYALTGLPNLSLEATRLRRDETASDWETTLITYRGRRAWAAARLCSSKGIAQLR